ncbi:D-alanyl-D-alanine carboxypeptidase / D-alanyl-D-alanine-endopeptidase (penicillin-binding protein 4) [Limimonas halophila]|uniref:D-alanyl-D-alanine carboxypeptidase / D-alanyl-D-alanine-endopeptidase (Penicillin-binding protein 4) n=2 Tax=Limimonas halophila TaxID=1082479 RepID=A0A1G7LYC5_9PROT|nr:D-alanyl-D-alanine carboxypeptidase / D-alanyl-D-alanine-endopeptidase (penicillin-binding protein 4) [Limimonas halophila]
MGIRGGLVAALTAAWTPAAAINEVVPEPPDPTASSPRAVMSQHGFEPGNVGYILRELDSGKVVAAHNAATPFIPASVAKIPTAVTALAALGPDHRFTTRVFGTGPVRKGELGGDLVLVGGGDPLLEPADLMALCRRVRAAGIRRIAGAFRYDPGVVRRRQHIAADQPADARYNPGLSGLTMGFNQIRVDWRPKGANGTVAANLIPSVPVIDLTRAERGNGPGQLWQPEVNGSRTVWQLDPHAPRRGSANLPVKHPGRVTAQVFQRMCEQAGVRLPAPRQGETPADARPLARVRSRPVREIAKAMLAYSNNLVAELLGLAASRELVGKQLSLRASAATVSAWWRERRTGIDWSTMHLANHSGLSADARLTPAQVAAMLRDPVALGHTDGVSRGLPSLLPASGGSAGMAERLDGPATAYKVWAKTGTMFYASGLAGYLYPESGRRLAFALFVNDKAARRAYDRDPDRRRRSVQASASAWTRRAKDLEDALVRYWAREH